MKTTPALVVRFWGVRGSYPTPGPSTAQVGGNSSCVEVCAGPHTLAFDAGTGLIHMGRDLIKRPGDPEVHIFFAPAYSPEWVCRIYGARGGTSDGLERLLKEMMAPRLFPVSLSQLPAKVTFRHLAEHDRITFHSSPPTEVLARFSKAHPKVGVTLFRVNRGGRSVVYASDIEAPRGGHEDVVTFAHGADVLIHDAQYNDDEYHGGHLNKAGWGHSTVRMAAEAAREAQVGQLLLFHHDPEHDDAHVQALERLAKKIFPRTHAATEGLEIVLPLKR
jgi:phosphoribosyl 1,2-cyclic phosphodiesterase